MGFFSFFTKWFRKKPKPDPVLVTGVTMSGKALLVGINAYPSAPLSGCVNDVSNVANMLMQKYGFNPSQICILKDREATTANILSKLDWLVDVKPGEKVYFHYSGHGAQVPVGSRPSEPDGLTEIICPVDFNWQEKYMITDDQLAAVFARIPQGAIFNWASDSCHSGDLDKAMPKSAPVAWFNSFCNWIVKPFKKTGNKLISKLMPTPEHIAINIRRAKAKGMKAKGMINGVLDVGYISGCQSNQTSADTVIDGQPCGALTYYLVKNINAMPNAPLNQVVAAVVQDLANNGYSQRPVCSGARENKPFLMV